MPDVQNSLEVLGADVDLHQFRFGLHEPTMQFRHFLDQSVRNRVSDGVALDILWVKLSENLELMFY